MRSGFRVVLCAACLLAACKGSGQQAPPEHPIHLGQSVMLEPNVQYRVVGADVAVTHHGATARTFLVDNDPNKESHSIHATLDLVVENETKSVDVADREPYVWKGYRFSIDPLGFTWGEPHVRVVIDRAR